MCQIMKIDVLPGLAATIGEKISGCMKGSQELQSSDLMMMFWQGTKAMGYVN